MRRILLCVAFVALPGPTTDAQAAASRAPDRCRPRAQQHVVATTARVVVTLDQRMRDEAPHLGTQDVFGTVVRTCWRATGVRSVVLSSVSSALSVRSARSLYFLRAAGNFVTVTENYSSTASLPFTSEWRTYAHDARRGRRTFCVLSMDTTEVRDVKLTAAGTAAWIAARPSAENAPAGDAVHSFGQAGQQVVARGQPGQFSSLKARNASVSWIDSSTGTRRAALLPGPPLAARCVS